MWFIFYALKTIVTIIGLLAPFVVVYFVFKNIRKEKKKAKQKRLDAQISSIEKELFFHKDTVPKLWILF